MKLFSLLLFLLFLPGVTALTCLVDNAPIIHAAGQPTAICIPSSPNITDCYSYLENPSDSAETWGYQPEEPVKIEGFDNKYYFPVIDNVATISFSTENLYHNQTVVMVVACENETYRFNATPLFADYQAIGDFAVYGVRNAWQIVMLIFLIISILIIGGILIRLAK